MAVSKSNKKVKQSQTPSTHFSIANDPNKFYTEHPSWNFATCDTAYCPFSQKYIGDLFWSEILPRLQNLETQTWNDILIIAKKQNHAIAAHSLNTVAQRRLEEKMIEAESIISLRINGSHRLYGYMRGSVFNLLWIDLDHGDNDHCVCRSQKRHT